MQVLPSGQSCGATVTGVDLAGDLTPLIAAIHAAWLDHLVLAFPDQALDDDGLERFTRAFGSFGEDPFIAPIAGREHVLEIRREADEKTPLFAETWHSDWSFLTPPPAATLLHGRVIPPVGGDTLFANQYAAYDALADEVKAKIEGRSAWHSAARGYAPDGAYGDADQAAGRSMTIRPSVEARKRRLQPMVRVHPETGRKALFVNPGYTIGVDGMDEAEGWSLLLEIFQHQTSEAFVYRHRWSPNMLTMWDNRCLLHRATGGYEGYQRVLHRTTVAG
jgi:taurine dioxygenase